MTNTLEGKLVPVEAIDVAPEMERLQPDRVQDDALANSIRLEGIQQPLVLISKPDGRYSLIDGSRRLAIAQTLEIKAVPAVIDTLPEGSDPQDYQNRIRFLVGEQRQDLLPSQRAKLIRKMMEMFGMTQAQVAASLGVNEGSSSNWLAIEKYVPELVKAIDTGLTTAFHARSFDGVRPEAQSKLFRLHKKDMASMSGGAFHKMMRSRYSPQKFPEYYESPEKTIEKLKRKQRGRASKRRPTYTRDEKKKLMQSLDLQETEANDLAEEIKIKKRLCTLAGPPINAILRHPDLVGELERLHVDKDELEVFAESF